MDIVFKEESYAIIGACFEVYKKCGCGFLESVYQECLGHEFSLQGIPFQDQVALSLEYKGRLLTQSYKPDFLCYEKIVLEIKAIKQHTEEHRAQVHNYLKITGHKLGLLANFGHYPKLEYERIVR